MMQAAEVEMAAALRLEEQDDYDAKETTGSSSSSPLLQAVAKASFQLLRMSCNFDLLLPFSHVVCCAVFCEVRVVRHVWPWPLLD